MRRLLALLLLAMAALAIGIVSVNAQDSAVTADEVNAIAKKLFCPVCENIPLDACGTAACEDWRYEIRLQLEQGLTEQEIVDDFVLRFGDRVVGTPKDPILRALSLVTPVILAIIGMAVVWRLFGSWRSNQSQSMASQQAAPHDSAIDDYREVLERDLAG